LLEENNYFGTILPRIPKKIQDSIKVKLLLQGRRQEREKQNLAIVEFLKKGTKIRALYADEDNEPAVRLSGCSISRHGRLTETVRGRCTRP
jgi:pre-mRNA-splicing factor 38B